MVTDVEVKFVARQAILDREQNIFGYELLYRDSSRNSFPNDISDDAATARLFFDSLLFYGIDNLVNDKKAFINLSTSTILGDLPKLINSHNVVLEITERVEQLDDILAAVNKFIESNYVFALGDNNKQDKWQALFNAVQYIKIEAGDDVISTYNRIIDLKKQWPNKLIIVERIEDHKTFELMKKAGADYFQGYFFTQPKVINFKNISPSQATIFELLKITLQTPLNFFDLINKVEKDAALVARLLLLSNSRLKSTSKKISSISQAVIYLGEDTIKQFVTVLVLGELGYGKPSELLKLGLIRAKFIELLLAKKEKKLRDSGYFVGLISIFNAILDIDTNTLFNEFIIESEVKNAIAKQEGLLGEYLTLCLNIEQGYFMAIQDFQRKKLIKEAIIFDAYTDALSYADGIIT